MTSLTKAFVDQWEQAYVDDAKQSPIGFGETWRKLKHRIPPAWQAFTCAWDLEAYLFGTVGPAARNAPGGARYDFGQFIYIARWKSQRPLNYHQRNRDTSVQSVTSTAFALTTPAANRHEHLVGKLHGVQIRTASALLTVFDPETFSVLDVRAARALKAIELPDGAPVTTQPIAYWDVNYWAYVTLCTKLASTCLGGAVRLRALDRALWKWDKDGRP